MRPFGGAKRGLNQRSIQYAKDGFRHRPRLRRRAPKSVQRPMDRSRAQTMNSTERVVASSP